MSLAESIKQEAFKAGFDLAGVAPLDASQDLAFARRWVEQGFGGEMRYLQNPKRHDPRHVLPSAKSVVCVGLVYNADFPYSVERDSAGSSPSRGWISRYGWGRDYHRVMRVRLEKLRAAIGRLSPGAESRVYVDTGPIVERAFARLSGIGWTGKNTCLIHQELGSWFFLGVILTSLELAPDFPASDRCGSCTRCLDACPTGALTPYVMDASRCLAYFNIELKGGIPEPFRAPMGDNLFGCDICQDVCPWNRPRAARIERSAIRSTVPGARRQRRQRVTVSAPEFQPMEIEIAATPEVQRTSAGGQADRGRLSLFNPSLEALASISEDDFRRAFAHSPIKRVKYRGWLRNLCVVMGNSGDARFVPWLERMLEHSDPLAREHAAWALNRLRAARDGRDGEQLRSGSHNPA